MTQAMRPIEELSLNAWPCLETVYHDGWVLRFTNGYTRRANSVNAIYPATGELNDNIAYCESAYTGEGLRTVFKISPAVIPPDLDDRLAERGYVKDAPTSVQTMKLDDAATPDVNTVVIEQELSDAWLSVFCRLNNVDAVHLPAMKQMLTRIVPRTGFIQLKVQDQVAAVALAVQDGDYVGIFDVVTATHLRNRGLGRQLMLNVMQWGKSNGAQYAYLQVMLDNPPALHLYEKLGFREMYQYWYRVKDLR